MGERHALLVGVSFFQDEKLSRLLAPQEDVYRLREALLRTDVGGFSSAQVLFDSDLVAIQSALHDLFDNRVSDDLLLFYYTGHGLIDGDGSLYLSLRQTSAEKPSIGSLEAEFVRKRMKASHAQSQIIVLDCCHSGAFMAGAKRAVDQQAITQHTFDIGGTGQYVLSACSATEFAFEAGELSQGDPDARPRSIFTECLVNGLTTGDAAPQSEKITIDALYHFTRAAVLDRNMPMDPQRWITGGSGDLVVANNPDVRIPVPEELREELLVGSKMGRLGAVETLRKMLTDQKNPFQASQAQDILRDGLTAPEWVEVKDAILSALDQSADSSNRSPDVNEAADQPSQERILSSQSTNIEDIANHDQEQRGNRLHWFGTGAFGGVIMCLLVGAGVWLMFGPPFNFSELRDLQAENSNLRSEISNLETSVGKANDAKEVAFERVAAGQQEYELLHKKLLDSGTQLEKLKTVETQAVTLKKKNEELQKEITEFQKLMSDNEDLSLAVTRLKASLLDAEKNTGKLKQMFASLLEDDRKRFGPVAYNRWQHRPISDSIKGLEEAFAAADEVLFVAGSPTGQESLLVKDSQGRITSWTNANELPDFATLREEVSYGVFAPELIVVPSGTFSMGSPLSEDKRKSDEGDLSSVGQKTIVFKENFAIGRTEVTFSEWSLCVADGGCRTTTPADTRGRVNHPVVNVSWNDAQSYVAWLNSKLTGDPKGPYRLPSESEWEYSARGGTLTPFWTGATISPSQANYNGVGTYANGSQGENRGQIIDVASLDAPNPWGLHDVHGNVWEWVQDPYQNSLAGIPTDGSPRPTEKENNNRVLRGGAWNNFPANLRAANRYNKPADTQLDSIGFRIARTLNP